MMELYARLSKDGNKVLCAITYCRGVLGDVVVQVQRESTPPTLVLALPPGWYKQQGMWQLTRHAKKNAKLDYAPELRRHPASEWKNPFMVIRSYPTLPCRAYCPQCNRPQVLDPDRLNVIDTPMNPWSSADFEDPMAYLDHRWFEPVGDQGDLQISTPPPPYSPGEIQPDNQ